MPLRFIYIKTRISILHLLTGKSIIDKKIQEIEVKLASGQELHGFLSYLLSNKTLSQGEIYSNVTEMMLAAVDTV